MTWPAEDAKTPTLVNVKAKSYRHVALYEPGEWKAVLKCCRSKDDGGSVIQYAKERR
jgi:hypothetical protein